MTEMHSQTKIIQATKAHDLIAKPVAMPLYLSTTFHRNADGSYTDDYIYTRHDNPNRRLLEGALAELEGGNSAFAFASGMAAIHAVFASLSAGDHVILPDDVYFNINKLMARVFTRWGLEYTTVDMTDMKAIRSAIMDNTKLIWIETPSNPMLKITDIRAVSQLGKEHGILVGVDNTWSTPIHQRPLDLGADIVMHSTTKYFGGHSDVLGGCVIVKDDDALSDRLLDLQQLAGGVPSPFDSWLVTRGLQTLPVRVKTQSETAFALAQYLEQHPKVARVYYPGLKSHPQYEVAQSQMIDGYGAMLSVEIVGDGQRAIDIANGLELFATATSLGGVESLVEHRRSVEGPDSHTPENLLRVSVGLEHIDDLKADWDRVL